MIEITSTVWNVLAGISVTLLSLFLKSGFKVLFDFPVLENNVKKLEKEVEKFRDDFYSPKTTTVRKKRSK